MSASNGAHVVVPEAPSMDNLTLEQISESMYVLFRDDSNLVGCDGQTLYSYRRPGYHGTRYILQKEVVLDAETAAAVATVADAIWRYAPPAPRQDRGVM